MSRHFKNIGSYDLIVVSCETGGVKPYSYLGELKAGETADFDSILRFAVRADVAKQFSNFYINYTINSSGFQTSTSNICPTWESFTYNNIDYVVMSQFFGTRTTADYATVEPKYIEGGNTTINCNIEHAKCELTGDTWYINSKSAPITINIGATHSFDFTITTDTDYTFPSGSLYYVQDNSTTQSYNIPTSTTTFSITKNLSTSTGVDTITFTSNVVPYTAVLTITEHIPNSSLTYTPEIPKYGDTIIFTISANTGYIIKSAYAQFTDYTGHLETDNFTINSDGLTATLTLDTSTSMGSNARDISVYATTQISENVPTTSIKFINVYRLTQDNLTSLATKRWYIADSANPQNVVDLAYYISSLKKFYCNIPTSVSGNIALAWFDTEITAEIVSSDYVTIDCGTLEITNPNNNINDFTNTEIQILLPFIGIQTLDSYKIIGNNVHLYYKASTITGDCVAVIESNNVILYEFTGNIAENIPYVLNNIQWQLKGAIEVNSTILYGFTPILTVFYHDNYNDNNTILLNDEKYSLLSDLTGLNYVNDVVITDSSIPDDVATEIERVLTNGVIFG